jgi:hypothetical protein
MKKNKYLQRFNWEDWISPELIELKRQLDSDMLIYGVCGYKEDENGKLIRVHPMEIKSIIKQDEI